jgi:hypothetical protein
MELSSSGEDAVMDNPFGVDPGKVTDLSSSGLSNDFTNIANNDPFQNLESDRVQPRQVASGVERGTKRIVNIDGSYITLGEIPDSGGEFGIAFFTRDGVLIKKDTGLAQTIYDDAGRELVTIDSTGFLLADAIARRIKLGTAPDDGRVGFWVTEPNEDVITELGG